MLFVCFSVVKFYHSIILCEGCFRTAISIELNYTEWFPHCHLILLSFLPLCTFLLCAFFSSTRYMAHGQVYCYTIVSNCPCNIPAQAGKPFLESWILKVRHVQKGRRQSRMQEAACSFISFIKIVAEELMHPNFSTGICLHICYSFKVINV